MKKFLATILSAVLIFTAVPFVFASAETSPCTEFEGYNTDEHNYRTYGDVINSYLTSVDSGFMRVQGDISETGYILEYYSSDFVLESVREIPLELPIFGGFYESETNYYILSGQINLDEKPDVECFRLTKYDRSWNRLSSVGLYDCNTSIPFDAGSARFSESGKYLFVRTCHEMYRSDDGYRHQANVTIQYDVETMTVTDSYTEVMNTAYGYVSHSFNQFIHTEDNHIVAVDHGDGYPRSIALLKYKTDFTTGKFVPDFNSLCEVVDVQDILGDWADNYTGVSVGGFELSADSYLVAYNSIPQDENFYDHDTRNIFVGSVSRADSSVVAKQITNYAEDETSPSTPVLVKISDESFLLLWTLEEKLFYVALDSKGDMVGEINSSENTLLSDCAPLVLDDRVIWYVFENNVVDFYEINLKDMALSKTTSDNSHKFEVSSYPDELGGDCTKECTRCHKEETFATITDFMAWWKLQDSTDGYYWSYMQKNVFSIGEKLYVDISDDNNDRLCDDKLITFSKPSGISYTKTSDYGDDEFGYFTFEEEGEYTITITYRYNPKISYSYNVKVLGPRKLGDVNYSGSVDSRDYVAVKRHCFGALLITDPESLAAANVNGDKNEAGEPIINSRDYVLIKRHCFKTYKITPELLEDA